MIVQPVVEPMDRFAALLLAPPLQKVKDLQSAETETDSRQTVADAAAAGWVQWLAQLADLKTPKSD